jgi:DNA-binding transcriptional LysR family regulator
MWGRGSGSIGMASRITLRQLEIFLSVVEHGSFRRASGFLGMSAVAVSEHIRALETRLRAELFDRSPGSSPVPNMAGQIAAERAREILASVDMLEADLCPEARRQTWRLGLVPFLARHLAGPISDIRKRFPERNIVTEIADQDHAEMSEMVAKGVLDVALLIGDTASMGQPAAGVEQHVIIEEPLSIFAGYSHPLAARSNLSQADLLPFPILKLSPSHPFRKMVDSSLKHAGLAGLKCDIETDDYLEILTKASAGEGLACMFTEGSHDAITHRLAPLDLAFSIPPLEALLLTGAECRHNQHLRIASEYLANQYRFAAATARRQHWHSLRSNLVPQPQ